MYLQCSKQCQFRNTDYWKLVRTRRFWNNIHQVRS